MKRSKADSKPAMQAMFLPQERRFEPCWLILSAAFGQCHATANVVRREPPPQMCHVPVDALPICALILSSNCCSSSCTRGKSTREPNLGCSAASTSSH